MGLTRRTGDRDKAITANEPDSTGTGEAVRERVRDVLRGAHLAEPHGAAIAAALAAPGNILSESPDYRWARIVWTCCVAAGGTCPLAVPAAAAVEIFMVALDLLDDIEDAEETPLVVALGTANAVNVSTALLLLAQRAMLGGAGPTAMALLLDAGLRACDGQHADLSSPPDRPRELEEALAVTAAKSSPLVELACRLGAHCADADAELQEQYARFGAAAGMAAQLANDLRAVLPGAVGTADIALRRPTLPLVYAATRAAAVGAPDDAATRPGSWDHGPIQLTWVVAETYRRHALELVPQLTSSPTSRHELAALLCVL